MTIARDHRQWQPEHGDHSRAEEGSDGGSLGEPGQMVGQQAADQAEEDRRERRCAMSRAHGESPGDGLAGDGGREVGRRP